MPQAAGSVDMSLLKDERPPFGQGCIEFPQGNIDMTHAIAPTRQRAAIRGGLVKARLLISNASYGPDSLKILFEAFDNAWQQLAPACGNDPQAVEATRVRLAETILALAQVRTTLDADELTESALKALSSGGI
jgi:hypothetical protein